MKPVTIKAASSHIVYDADVLSAPQPALFETGYWRDQQALEGSAPGRGSASFVRMGTGSAVLRRYLRGGWVARWNRDRYWYTGLARSRPFAEFELLRRMTADGLRVPTPLAALCDRHGLFYRAALLTERIAPAQPLEAHCGASDFDWSHLGRALAEFHRAGVRHADLNARNILIHERTGEVWLIDFDRCSYRPGQPVSGPAQLDRLQRSCRKFWPPQGADFASSWKALMQGYDA